MNRSLAVLDSRREEAKVVTSRRDPILGDVSRLHEMRDNHVKGNLVMSRSRFLERHYGKAMVQKVAERVSLEARTLLLDPPAAYAWQPLGPLIEVDAAIVAQAMGGDVGQMRGFGAEIASYDLSTVYRVFIRATMSPMRIMDRLPGIYGEYFKRGRLVASGIDGSRGRLEFSGALLPSYLCTFGFAGWIEAALGLAGAKAVDVVSLKCQHYGDPTCTLAVQWR